MGPSCSIPPPQNLRHQPEADPGHALRRPRHHARRRAGHQAATCHLCLQRRTHVHRELQHARHLRHLHLHGRPSRPRPPNGLMSLHHRDPRRAEEALSHLHPALGEGTRRSSRPSRRSSRTSTTRTSRRPTQQMASSASPSPGRPGMPAAAANAPKNAEEREMRRCVSSGTTSGQLHRQPAPGRLWPDARPGRFPSADKDDPLRPHHGRSLRRAPATGDLTSSTAASSSTAPSSRPIKRPTPSTSKPAAPSSPSTPPPSLSSSPSTPITPSPDRPAPSPSTA